MRSRSPASGELVLMVNHVLYFNNCCVMAIEIWSLRSWMRP